MSHFTVLVSVPKGKNLDSVMLPYHEYESTGIKKYTEWVESEYAEEEFKNTGKKNRRVFAKENQLRVIGGKFYRRTNPNSRWDWYVVGGRWHNTFSTCSGKKEAFGFSLYMQQIFTEAVNNYKKWHETYALMPCEEDLKSAEIRFNQLTNEQKESLGISDLIDFAKIRNAFEAIEVYAWNQQHIKRMKLSETEYGNALMGRAAVHAFISLDGQWHERGDMGWWGMCDDENENTFDGLEGEFWTFIKNLPDDTYLYLVDAHI